jgi:hypothetical protein
MWILKDFKLTWVVRHVHGRNEEIVEGSLNTSMCGLVLFLDKNL